MASRRGWRCIDVRPVYLARCRVIEKHPHEQKRAHRRTSDGAFAWTCKPRVPSSYVNRAPWRHFPKIPKGMTSKVSGYTTPLRDVPAGAMIQYFPRSFKRSVPPSKNGDLRASSSFDVELRCWRENEIHLGIDHAYFDLLFWHQFSFLTLPEHLGNVESVNGKPLDVCNNRRPSLFRSPPPPTTGPRPVSLSCRNVVRVSLLQVHTLALPLTVPSFQRHEVNDRSLYPWAHHPGSWRSHFFAIR